METLPGAPTVGMRHEFVYDSLGRRVRRDFWTLVGAGVLADRWSYVYDGWNIVAEIIFDSHMRNGYVWGLDVSGSEEGAGGVGGLLFILNSYGGLKSHSPTYDGNGNVTTLVRIDDIASKAGDLSGRYEYDPYGNELVMPVSASEIFESDYAAETNPFRFSTKYKDIWIGHYYFGYRYYNPSTGNWLSRDPIEEQGGSNVYGYVGNEPVGRILVRLKVI